MTAAPTGSPAGPLVAVCTGHRCAALRRLDGEDDAVGAPLREAVQASRGGVLVSSPCVGACARGPVVAVGQREEGRAQPGVVVWLGDLDADRRRALTAWVAALGESGAGDGGEARTVPAVLVPGVLGVRGPAAARQPGHPGQDSQDSRADQPAHPVRTTGPARRPRS